MRLFLRARKRGLTSNMFDMASRKSLERRARVRGRRSLKSGQSRRIKNPGRVPMTATHVRTAGVTCDRAACCFLPMQRLRMFVRRRRSVLTDAMQSRLCMCRQTKEDVDWPSPGNVPLRFGKDIISPTFSRNFHRPVSVSSIRYVKIRLYALLIRGMYLEFQE
jgi:hypothetical protein